MKRLYMIFYCIVRDDGTNTVHSRTSYLLEIFLTQIFIALSMVILGVANLRFDNFIHYILIMLPSPILAYIFIKYSFTEDRGKEITQNFSDQIKKRKTFFVLLTIGLFISVFIALILCGMLMSYLFSIYE